MNTHRAADLGKHDLDTIPFDPEAVFHVGMLLGVARRAVGDRKVGTTRAAVSQRPGAASARRYAGINRLASTHNQFVLVDRLQQRRYRWQLRAQRLDIEIAARDRLSVHVNIGNRDIKPGPANRRFLRRIHQLKIAVMRVGM